MTLPEKRMRAGARTDDMCRSCKIVRRHTVMVVDGDGRALRVVCDYCGSQHNYRGGGERVRKKGPRSERVKSDEPLPLVNERERSFATMEDQVGPGQGVDLEMMLRRIIREEAGLTPVKPADKWRGGEMVLRPGREGVQEKSWPIESFFHKIVMLRNKLRVMEQQINGAEIPEALKLKLQGYITASYGSLTSFNVLFADEDDRFRGSGGKS